MRVEYKTLTLEHFRCFGARQTFTLSPAPGLWFLRGRNEVEPTLASNGSGKSTLVEALFWILTGRTSKGLRNPDVKPWNGNGTPRGELLLHLDGESNVIARVATTNGLSINGKEVGPEEALKLLNTSPELLLNTTFLAQGEPLLFDRTPKEKMALFTEVLRLERWEERSARAGEKVRELDKLVAEIEGETMGTKAALTQTETLMERAVKASKEWVEAQEARAETVASDIKTLEEQLASAEVKFGELDLDYDEAWVRLRQMREDVRKLEREAIAKQGLFDLATLRLEELSRERKRLQRELDELGFTDECPVCKQPVTGTELGGHKKELRRVIAKLTAEIQAGVPKKTAEEYSSAKQSLETFRNSLQKVEQQTDDLQAKVNYAKPNIERIRAELLSLKTTRDVRQREENPYTEQVFTLRKQKRAQEATLEALQEDRTKALQQMERTKFWVKGFKDVALLLIEDVLQELEAVTNAILPEVGLLGWEVRYVLEKETKSGTVQRGINVVVVSPTGRGSAVKWESWSGGEGQRLRLVGALALSDVLLRHAGVSTNLEILDEPTQHLSAQGVADLCAYLGERAKANGKTVWVIDHMAREGAVFSGTVTVTKTKTGSVLS